MEFKDVANLDMARKVPRKLHFEISWIDNETLENFWSLEMFCTKCLRSEMPNLKKIENPIQLLFINISVDNKWYWASKTDYKLISKLKYTLWSLLNSIKVPPSHKKHMPTLIYRLKFKFNTETDDCKSKGQFFRQGRKILF